MRSIGGYLMNKALVLALLVSVSAGCGGKMNERTLLYLGKDAGGQEVLILGSSGMDSPCAGAGHACLDARPVTVTNNAADEEFWTLEAQVQVRAAIGIPYGRMPVDYAGIGPRSRCEAMRARAKSDTPTEPCQGPYYFRREAKQ